MTLDLFRKFRIQFTKSLLQIDFDRIISKKRKFRIKISAKNSRWLGSAKRFDAILHFHFWFPEKSFSTAEELRKWKPSTTPFRFCDRKIVTNVIRRTIFIATTVHCVQLVFSIKKVYVVDIKVFFLFVFLFSHWCEAEKKKRKKVIFFSLLLRLLCVTKVHVQRHRTYNFGKNKIFFSFI